MSTVSNDDPRIVKYHAQLVTNLDVLRTEVYGEGGRYPGLCRLLSRYGDYSLGKKLEALLETFINYQGVYSYHVMRRAEMTAPLDNLVTEHGGGKTTWNKAMWKLWALGLIKPFRPKKQGDRAAEDYNTPANARSAARAAQSQNRHPANWYRVPAYTPTVLMTAERRAPIIAMIGNGINKDSVRDMYGDRVANRVYDNGKAMSQRVKRQRKAIDSAMISLLTEKGWTVADEVIEAAIRTLVDELHALPADECLRRIRDIDGMTATWRAYKPTLLSTLKLVSSPPTQTEAGMWQLHSRQHIIRPRDV